jgi:uncharacterized membrane protein
MKPYRAIVVLCLFGCGATVLAALALRPCGLEGLLGGFVPGRLPFFTGMQMSSQSVLAARFDPDKRRMVHGLCVLVVVADAQLTAPSLQLGPQAFGYRFALSPLRVVTIGLLALSRSLARLEYSTFVLR